jgi:hypothetical protein
MSCQDAKKISMGMDTGITWRQVGIQYRATTNEILVDVIETLDAIVDQRGTIITAELSGVVRHLFIHCIFALHVMYDQLRRNPND